MRQLCCQPMCRTGQTSELVTAEVVQSEKSMEGRLSHSAQSVQPHSHAMAVLSQPC